MSHTPFNRLYYTIKPYLPRSLRMAVRRWFAMQKLRESANTWPILEEAGQPPNGWPGWPDGKRFALVLTHDVEGAAGLAKCRKLAEIERELGFCSAFNFIPEGGYVAPLDFRRWLVANGFEVGVHDLYHDGWLYQTRSIFRKKAERINQYLRDWNAQGFRSGFMHHNYDWLHDLEILYDASSFDTDPFEPQPDGVHTIFPLWVPSNRNGESSNSRSGYVELPYTLPQDSTLFLLFRHGQNNVWKQKLDWIAECGGMALLTVHPDYVRFDGEAPSSSTFPVGFYADFLTHVRERYAGAYWNVLPHQMATFALTSGCRERLQPLPASYFADESPMVRRRIASQAGI